MGCRIGSLLFLNAIDVFVVLFYVSYELGLHKLKRKVIYTLLLTLISSPAWVAVDGRKSVLFFFFQLIHSS